MQTVSTIGLDIAKSVFQVHGLPPGPAVIAITKWSIASVWHRAFSIRTRDLEIDRKKMTGQIGRSTFVSPVARGYSASVMLSDGPYSSTF
jgi:hypothetical protein